MIESSAGWPNENRSAMGAPRSERLRLGVITDLHAVDGDAACRWHSRFDFEAVDRRLREACEHARLAGCEVLAVLGDLTHRAQRGRAVDVMGRIDQLGLPTLVVAGNHDFANGVSVALPVSCAPPPEIGVSFLALRCQPVSRGVFAGVLPPLRTDAVTIVLSHFPLLSFKTQVTRAGLKYAGDLLNQAALEDVVRAHAAPTVVLSGHLHIRATATQGSTIEFSMAPLIERPGEIGVVDIDLLRLTAERRGTLLDPGTSDHVVARLSPQQERWRFDDGRWRPAGWLAGYSTV